MKFIALIKKPLSVSIFLAVSFVIFSYEINAQDRQRVVTPKVEKQTSTRPTTRIPASPNSRQQTLTNEIIVKKQETPQSLVRKTSQSQLTTAPVVANRITTKAASKNAYSAITRSLMLRSIQNKIGIRYRLGTQGPNLYDCSGFVWKVFQEAGMPFTRTSAREFWRTFEPVSGDERYQFGTLVFFNRLGHVGIVADENGFYHASSSKGITYSKFAGYWEKRIVGYRRVPLDYGLDNELDNFGSEDK